MITAKYLQVLYKECVQRYVEELMKELRADCADEPHLPQPPGTYESLYEVANEDALDTVIDTAMDEINQLRNKEQVLYDMHKALGINWGDDPYAVINFKNTKIEELTKALKRVRDFVEFGPFFGLEATDSVIQADQAMALKLNEVGVI
jgi:hypothetical protein